jgi:RimJ/RimL family protein N-acetyltransferase
MPHYKKIVGIKCYLSPLSPEDAALTAVWENDLEVTLPLGDEAYTTSGLEKIAEGIAWSIQHQTHTFSIVDLESERLIGRGMLFNVDPVNRKAMLGILIGEKEFWGRGYGQEATALLVEFGFVLLNLNSIELGVFAFNERAIAVYRKIGFKEIGRRREMRIIAGKKYDVILMDILAEEYTPRYLDKYIPG